MFGCMHSYLTVQIHPSGITADTVYIYDYSWKSNQPAGVSREPCSQCLSGCPTALHTDLKLETPCVQSHNWCSCCCSWEGAHPVYNSQPYCSLSVPGVPAFKWWRLPSPDPPAALTPGQDRAALTWHSESTQYWNFLCQCETTGAVRKACPNTNPTWYFSCLLPRACYISHRLTTVLLMIVVALKPNICDSYMYPSIQHVQHANAEFNKLRLYGIYLWNCAITFVLFFQSFFLIGWRPLG